MKEKIQYLANRMSLKGLTAMCLLVSLIFGFSLVFVLVRGMRSYESQLSQDNRYMQEKECEASINQTLLRISDTVSTLSGKRVFSDFVLGGRSVKSSVAPTVIDVLNDAVDLVPEVNTMLLCLDSGEYLYNSQGISLGVTEYKQMLSLMRICREEHIGKTSYYVPEYDNGEGKYLLAVIVPFMNWQVAGKERIAWCIVLCTAESLTQNMYLRDRDFSLYNIDRLLSGSNMENSDFMKCFFADSGLNIRVKYDESEFTITNQRAMRLILSTLCVFLLSEGLLIFCIYLCMVLPIRDIVRKLRNVTLTSMQVRTDMKQNGELGKLVRGINGMLANVETLNHECIEQKIRLISLENAHLQARILFLQAQINPHFLYNSLECVNGMIKAGYVDQVPDVIGCIARIYRYCTGVDTVCLEEEIEIVRQYVDMMNTMRDAEYTLEVNISTGVMEVSLPRMIVQPVVENAIQHGFSHPLRQNGAILINGTMQEGILELTVSDNGNGMPIEEIEQVNRMMRNMDGVGRQIGITNVTKRLMLLYGGMSGVTLSRNDQGGVNADIVINLEYEQNSRTEK